MLAEIRRKLILVLGYILVAVIAAEALNFSFFAGEIEAIRVNFGHLVIILSSILLGPWWGALIGASTDVIGFLLQPDSPYKVYLPSITALSALRGLIPGLIYRFCKGRIPDLANVLLAVAVPQALFSIVAMSYILFWNFGIDLQTSLTNRFIVQAATIPTYALLIYLILRYFQQARKNAQLVGELQENEKRLNTLISNTPAVIYSYMIVDGKPEINYINQNVKKLLGYEPEEMINNQGLFKENLHPDDAEKVFNAIPELITRGKASLGEYRFKDKQGRYRWLYDEQQLITHEDGTLEAIGIWWDISDRKSAEEKIRDYTRALETKGEELEDLYRQLNEELDKARAMHEMTLPVTMPRVEGVSLAAYYQPARRLGGDFYYAQQAGDKLVLYVSDVTGHGLDGALLSAFVKECVDSYIMLRPEAIDPGSILRHLDHQYRRQNYPQDYFICIFLMVLDLNTMELSYTGAGFQELPLVQTGDGSQLRLMAEGPPLSTTIEEELMDFTVRSMELTPGTTLLVSTDGLTEQRAGDEVYNGRLEQVFYAHSHLPPELILRAVKEDFIRFNGGTLQGDDDITLELIQAEPAEKRKKHLELESDVEALDRLRREAMDFMPENQSAEPFLLGLHELAANAMEHGNGFDPQKKVFVELSATRDYLFASVQDQGPGFAWTEKKDNPLNLAGDRERGRGIAMTQLCCGKLYYNETGNRAFFAVETGKQPVF